MVRMLILMGLVTRKITGRQTIQVIDDIADEDNGIKNVGKGRLYSHQHLNIEEEKIVQLSRWEISRCALQCSSSSSSSLLTFSDSADCCSVETNKNYQFHKLYICTIYVNQTIIVETNKNN